MSVMGLLLVPLLAAAGVHVAGNPYADMFLEAGPGQAQVLGSDLDGDGTPELLVAAGTHVSVYRFANGGFEPWLGMDTGSQSDELDVGDLNGDGRPDIVVANHDTDHLTLLLAQTDGTFAQPQHSPLRVTVDPHVHVVRVVDVNADGRADLLVDNRNGHSLVPLLGDGHGRFLEGEPIAVGGDPYRGFAVADLDNDGGLDLVAPLSDRVAIVLRDGPGYRRAADVPASAPFAVAVADFDGDANTDLLVADDGRRSEVRIFLGDGSGAFTPGGPAAELRPGGKNVAVGDINGDGLGDGLASSWSGDLLAVLGGADGVLYERIETHGTPWGLAIADFNGDRRGDIVVADGERVQVRVLLSQDAAD